MIVELGHFALIVAFVVAVLQMVLPMLGAQRRDITLMAVAGPASVAQFLLIAVAFGALTYAYVVDDFSLKIVVGNSHTLKPMLYKVAGVWGNHEGSLLLWVLDLSFFGACVHWFGGNLPRMLKARVLAVQGSIGVAFLAFMLWRFIRRFCIWAMSA
jgi:cytochrome c-type biogenesis protein CcmF